MSMRFVRRKRDGQRGEVVEVGGKRVFRIQANPLETKDDPFKEADFTEDYPDRALNPLQVAFVAYEADCASRQAFGDYSVKKEWAQLQPGEKTKWLSGPELSKAHPARQELFDAIWKVMKKYSLPM